MNPPVLAQPNTVDAQSGKRPFVIYTDASQYGIGAILSQEGEDGLLHPLYFASRSLTKAERNYHITDAEALAVVFAIRKFHFFIYGMDGGGGANRPLTSHGLVQEDEYLRSCTEMGLGGPTI